MQREKRRLVAIVATDVVGYSRLIGQDEEGTLRTLRAHRTELIDPLIEEHGGRIANTAGDGLLLDFPSAVDAVRCSIAIQEGMAGRNNDVDADKQICIRIGINVGDVIAEGDDLLGDGVNIAARLEGICEAGGILLSDDAYRQVHNRIETDFGQEGPKDLKNIVEPVTVWRWPAGETTTSSMVPATTEAGAPVGGTATHSLPDKPSIAVLPFDNMSGDPEQEFFSDGVAEDIITELSRFRNLFVIARNSSFTYKGKSVRMRDVGRELGVHYVVVGSIRKAGNRIRVTVQLIDAATENPIWAERYDRELKDIFEVQDELTLAIVGALPSRLEAADIERVKRKQPQDMAAYDYVLRSKVLHHRGTREANAEALDVLNKAIEIDPEYAPAYAWKACTLRQAVLRGYSDEPEVAGAQRIENAQRALALDQNDMECLRILCEINMEQRDLDLAEQYHNRAFTMNPNDPRMLAQRGELSTWMGRPSEAVEWLEQAMRLDPLGANDFAHLLGRALRADRRYADAIDAYKRVAVPRYQHKAEMAACHAELGNDAEAERQGTETLRLKPEFTIASYLASLSYREAADVEQLRNSLRKAGLPE